MINQRALLFFFFVKMKGEIEMRKTTTLLVGFDRDKETNDKPVLIIGVKKKGNAVDVINAFDGEEAVELYEKLVGDKKGFDD